MSLLDSWRQFLDVVDIFFHEVLYINMASRYTKQKLNPDNVCDVMQNNMPGKEHILTGTIF